MEKIGAFPGNWALAEDLEDEIVLYWISLTFNVRTGGKLDENSISPVLVKTQPNPQLAWNCEDCLQGSFVSSSHASEIFLQNLLRMDYPWGHGPQERALPCYSH